MQRATTEQAEYKMEPKSSTAWLSPFTVELIEKGD